MKTPPEDLPVEAIANALADHWNMGAAFLTYAPLGYGSHHWIAETRDGGKWFVTVDDLHSAYLGETPASSFEVLGAAFQSTATLRDAANLSFVNAPIADITGRWLFRLDERYSMAVFPYLDVEPTEFNGFPHETDRDDALRLVGKIHQATPHIAVDQLREETFLIPNRDDLLRTLGDLNVPWKSGPYSEPTRLLLRDHDSTLRQRLDQFDRVTSEALAAKSHWVVTHGEPHAGNIIRTRSGGMVVVDWAGVAFAPPERDLWMLLDEVKPDWSAYQEVTNVESLSNSALTAYRLHWNLKDIAVFVSWFRGPHEQTEEMEMIWAELQSYVKEVAFSLCTAG